MSAAVVTLLTGAQPATRTVGLAARLGQVIEVGHRYIGLPYTWGGKQPPQLDCSGFVAWVYREALRLELTAFTDAIADETVSVDNPLPGDIVLYRYVDPGQPGVRYPHIGLWLNEAQTLDSRSSVGVGVHEHVRKGTVEPRRHRALVSLEEIPMPLTREQVIALSNAIADEYDIPHEVMLGCAIAESNLNPNARRPADPPLDRSYWPDVSAGLWQQTVRWSKEYTDLGFAGEYPGSDVTERILQLYYDPWHAGRVAAPQIRAKLRMYRDPLAALCRYNWPSQSPERNPNRANYARGLQEARRLLGQVPSEDS